MHVCLTSIKHGATRNILFPKIIWLQNMQRDKSMVLYSLHLPFAISISYSETRHAGYDAAPATTCWHRSQGSGMSIFSMVCGALCSCKYFKRCTCEHLLHRWLLVVLPIVVIAFKAIHFEMKKAEECVSSFPFLCLHFLFSLFESIKYCE